MSDQEQTRPTTDDRRPIVALVALVFGILTALTLIGAGIWVAVLVPEAGGFALMGVLPIMGPVIGALGALGVIFGIIALFRRTARGLAVTGLCLSLTPVIAILIAQLIAALSPA